MADTLSELIPALRMKMGDINPTTYRYMDEWLLVSLQTSIKALARFWESKYLIDSLGVVTRNELYTNFEFASPPIIQVKDEWIIILMAAIIIKSGSLENAAWDLGSWRDAEQSYSNIASGDKMDASLKADWLELSGYIKVPMKRTMIPARTSFTLISNNN